MTLLYSYQGSNPVPGNGAFDIPFAFKVEYEYRHLGLLTEADGRQVHDTELVTQDLIIGQAIIEDGVLIFFRRLAIDAVHLGGFEQDVSFEFAGAQGGRGIRGDRKSTRLNSSHTVISYAVFCLKKKTNTVIV